MNLMHFLRRPISLRQRLILTIGAILLVFELISVFWLWHESTEQIQLFEQALRDNRNNDRHIMREIREAVASLIVPGVFMVSLTLFICYQAVRRITRPLAELQKELEARTADNLTPIAIHSATVTLDAWEQSFNLSEQFNQSVSLPKEVEAIDYLAHPEKIEALKVGDPSECRGEQIQICVARYGIGGGQCE